MGSIGLPDIKSSDIHLVLATEEEALAQTHANSSEWKGALNLDAYLRRESCLSKQELTRDGGLTAWALVYQPAGSETRQALCGCETIKKKAVVGRNGEVEDAVAYGIGSVFCPPDFRGKGYAGRMMSELGKRLQEGNGKTVQGCLFSVLYSDIGKKFYSARGWHPFPSAHISLQPTASTSQNLAKTKPLFARDLPELCALDEKLLRSRLSNIRSDRPAVAIIPDHATLAWHHARDDFVANELFEKDPSVKGAIVGEPGSRVWCYWTRVWPNPQEQAGPTLHILRLVIEAENFSEFSLASSDEAARQRDSPLTKTVAAVLAAAQAEASEWQMQEVQLWNPTSTAFAAAQLIDPAIAIEHRQDESIASLQWHGEGSWDNVDWVCNEKHGWC